MPTITPTLLGELMAAGTSRARKKLDADPSVAKSWTWSEDGREVRVRDEVITLAAQLASAEDIRCTCLLSPRCFHVLAVISVLPLAQAPEAAEQAAPDDKAGADDALTLDPSQLAATREAWRVGSLFLEGGIFGVATTRLGEILRAAHLCRVASLPRLESALLAIFEAARDHREQSPSFRLEEASASLAELLLCALQLERGATDYIGVSRRAYAPTRGLKLAGIASAPIFRRGYAGVVTYFTDGQRVYSAQEVLPGEIERAQGAQEAQLRFGEISLTHREAAHSGLLFARAEASADGRLGAGKNVVCAAIARDEALIDALFEVPLSAQLARADRGEDSRLLFIRGVFVESQGDFWLARTDDATHAPRAIPARVVFDDYRFACRDNLRHLAQEAAPVRVIARLGEEGLAIEPIAFAFSLSSGSLPTSSGVASSDQVERPWFSLDYDRVAQAQIPRGDSAFMPARGATSSALDPARRRVHRMTMAGARSLPRSAHVEVTREVARLRRALMPTLAATLDALARERHAPAGAWLRLYLALQEAERAIARASW